MTTGTTAPAPADGTSVRALLRVAGPVVAGGLVTVALSGNDTFLVGRFGAGAVAAAGIAVSVHMVCAVLVAGLGIAAQLHTARHTGAGAPEAAARAGAVTAALATLAGAALAALLLLLAGPLVAAVTDRPELRADAAGYLRVLALGLPLVGLGAALRGFAAGIGRTGVVLTASVAAAAVDVALAVSLISAGAGPRAVAAATVTAAAVSAAVTAAWLYRQARRGVRTPRWSDLAGWRADAGAVWRTGWPESAQLGLGTLSMVIVVALLAPYGQVILAAARTADVIVGAVWTVLHGCGTAIAVLAGQRHGAGDPAGARRVETAGWRLVAVVAGLPAVIGLVGTPAAVRLLVDAPAVAEALPLPIVLLVWAQVAFMAAITVTNGMVRATGDTRTGLRASLIAEYAVFVPAGLLLCRVGDGGLAGLYAAHLLYWAAYLAVVARRRHRLRR